MTVADQRTAALAVANEVRLARSRLKHRVRAEGLPAAMDVIVNMPPEAEGMTTSDLLAIPVRWGAIRVGKFLAELHISESRMLRDLTPRQRGVLVAKLEAIWRRDES